MLGGGIIAVVSLMLVYFFQSIMFPTIFSLAIEDLGELKPQGSGILCTAIAGGALGVAEVGGGGAGGGRTGRGARGRGDRGRGRGGGVDGGG